MFVVYKITNIINNMCYIGSSTRVQYRWQQHKNASQNPNSPRYNYPLYEAFREFGIENFSFEIIKDDFDSIWDMEEYEQEMINYYNSLKPNGYNQTKFTHSNNIASENLQKYIKKISCKCAKVDLYENIIEIYSSYHDAARKNGKNGEDEATKVRNVCKGISNSCFDGLLFRDLDNNDKIISQKVKSWKGKKSVLGINIQNPLEEIYFDSITAAAEFLKTERKSISQCIQGSKRYSVVKGYIFREIDVYGNIILNDIDIEERIKQYQIRNPIINGVQNDIATWCKIYNIKPDTVNYRIRNGWDSVKAITTPVKGR